MAFDFGGFMRFVLFIGSILVGLNSFAADREGEESAPSKTICADGKAASFQCSKTDLLSVIDLKSSGIPSTAGNDIWGWTDSVTGREYAIMVSAIKRPLLILRIHLSRFILEICPVPLQGQSGEILKFLKLMLLLSAKLLLMECKFSISCS